jgi:hypothetical protein
MEAARTSETSLDIQLTRQYIPEDSELHTRRRENMKSHTLTDRSDRCRIHVKSTTTQFFCDVMSLKPCN